MELLIDLNSDCPIYEQIYEFIKNEIKNGQILPETKLPSTRSLAQGLKISRTTVVNAYEQLSAEGYLKSRGGSGYIVNRLDVLNIERKKYKREAKREDFKIEDDDKEYQVRIVGTGEVGIEDGVMISFDSPIGQAIRGKKAGETVKMRHESGRKSIKILAIS